MGWQRDSLVDARLRTKKERRRSAAEKGERCPADWRARGNRSLTCRGQDYGVDNVDDAVGSSEDGGPVGEGLDEGGIIFERRLYFEKRFFGDSKVGLTILIQFFSQ